MNGMKSFFTLVELLVVIAIIALLASILMPSLNQAMRVAKRIVCANNQKQLHLSWMNYVDTASGALPASRTSVWGDSNSSTDPVRPLRKWPQLMTLELESALNPQNKNLYMPRKFLTCPVFRYPDPLSNYSKNRCHFGMPIYGIGGCDKKSGLGLTKVHQIRTPSRMPAFGDNPEDVAGKYAQESDLKAGTVAFRHFKKANVIYADGHIQQEKNTFDILAESKNNQ